MKLFTEKQMLEVGRRFHEMKDISMEESDEVINGFISSLPYKQLDTPIIKDNAKLISSIVAVGDVIEVEWLGELGIYKVDDFKVILNNPYHRPIDFVIHVKLSYNDGDSNIECTSDNFKYIRHISHSY